VSRVSALYIYPIKSCGGIAVTSARIESRGLGFDRRYMLVDHNGRFLTQRQLPAMALLRTTIDGDALHVAQPGGEVLHLPLEPSFRNVAQVKVWRSELEATTADEPVNRWFSEYLERPVRLVYMAEHQHRRVSSRRATRSGDEVSFADGAPILLIGEGSLAALNARLRTPVSMRRFRPNIVVDASEAFIEDTWRKIGIGGTELEVAWACARCTMTTVNPESGIADANGEPLRTLREFRRDGANVIFGRNVLTRGAGRISVGDALEIIESR
jgi:uncharacterized protein YcbX